MIVVLCLRFDVLGCNPSQENPDVTIRVPLYTTIKTSTAVPTLPPGQSTQSTHSTLSPPTVTTLPTPKGLFLVVSV